MSLPTAPALPALPAVPALSGNARVFFVIADPVAQLKAQVLFNHLFRLAHIDAVVAPAQVRAERLTGFVHEAFEVGNVGGLIVSIPHKTALARLVSRCDAAAAAAGAVNAVRRGADGRLEGALLDGVGCVAALAHHRMVVTGQRVLLVGCGGAGAAIATALAGAGVAELGLFDVDAARAQALAARLRGVQDKQAAQGVQPVPIQVLAAPDPAGWPLIVQATPLGLQPNDPPPVDPARIDAGAAVFDVLMTRQPSPLVRACRARGLRAQMGREMLVQQLPAYLDFFGYAALAAQLREPGNPLLGELRAMIAVDDAEARGAPAAAAPATA